MCLRGPQLAQGLDCVKNRGRTLNPEELRRGAAARRRAPPSVSAAVRSRCRPPSTPGHTGQTFCALRILLKSPSGFQFYKYALPPYKNPIGLVLFFAFKPDILLSA
jgi:hypothetical protein